MSLLSFASLFYQQRVVLTWVLKVPPDELGTWKFASWLFRMIPDFVITPDPNQEFRDLQKSKMALNP